MTEETEFEKFRPTVTEQTRIQAAQAYGRGDEIVSLDGKEAGLDSFILVLATDAARHGPFLLTATCARELCGLLAAAGFEPRGKGHPPTAD